MQHFSLGTADIRAHDRVLRGFVYRLPLLQLHDDVMDKDAVRRGNPTIHKQFETLYEDTLSESENRHYAESMAYTLGDFGGYLGQILLNESDFPLENKSKAITHYVNKILEVTYGQMLDLTVGLSEPATENDVLLIHRYKTGDYSGSLPMMVGGMLAGADDEVLDAMFEYGWRIGTAYQIRDDEIGLFGETETIGKPAGSDIRQNKNTILKVKAMELADDDDRTFLKDAYGNEDLSKADLENVRNITKETGAYEYSRSVCYKLVDEAREYIEQVSDNKPYQELMHSAATFMIERNR